MLNNDVFETHVTHVTLIMAVSTENCSVSAKWWKYSFNPKYQ